MDENSLNPSVTGLQGGAASQFLDRSLLEHSSFEACPIQGCVFRWPPLPIVAIVDDFTRDAWLLPQQHQVERDYIAPRQLQRWHRQPRLHRGALEELLLLRP